jgi:hypothetical protein
MEFFRRNEVEERPRNYEEIKRRLGKERPNDSEHLDHVTLDDLGDTPTHNDLVNCMLPLLHGAKPQGLQNRRFTVMKPAYITTAKAKQLAPDYYEGVNPRIVDKDLRTKLRTSIVPSNYNRDPIAPNFFLEFVPESEYPVVTRWQAGIDGVLGARCMNSLQNYPEMMPDEGPPPQGWEFDGNAYAFGLTYRPRDLTIYSVHMTPPEPHEKMPGYRIVQIEIYSMVSESSYHEAITAYRNVRDLAQEYRDRIVAAASSRAAQLRVSGVLPSPEQPASREEGVGSSHDGEIDMTEERHDGEKNARSTEYGDEFPLAACAHSSGSSEGPANAQQDVLSLVASEDDPEDDHQDELRGFGSQPAADNPVVSLNGADSVDDPLNWGLRSRRKETEE